MTSSHHARAWSPEMDERLKVLIAEGLSASGAGRALGVSRNAVIGRASRIGLTLNHSKAGPKVARARVRHAPTPIVEAPPPPEAPVSLALDLMSVGDQNCRWPSGSGISTTFCGHPPVYGSPYCQFHKTLAAGKPMAPWRAAQ
jgi:GcrA cell cycle regulator